MTDLSKLESRARRQFAALNRTLAEYAEALGEPVLVFVNGHDVSVCPDRRTESGGSVQPLFDLQSARVDGVRWDGGDY